MERPAAQTEGHSLDQQGPHRRPRDLSSPPDRPQNTIGKGLLSWKGEANRYNSSHGSSHLGLGLQLVRD